MREPSFVTGRPCVVLFHRRWARCFCAHRRIHDLSLHGSTLREGRERERGREGRGGGAGEREGKVNLLEEGRREHVKRIEGSTLLSGQFSFLFFVSFFLF